MGTEPKSIYAFLGDNEFLKEEEQSKVISRYASGTDNPEIVELDGSDSSFQDIETAILSRAMFSQSKIVRIRRVDEMPGERQSRLADVLAELAGDTLVILSAVALDGRGKLMKTLKSLGTVREFRNMNQRDAVQWCRDRAKHYKIRLGPREAELLVELIGTDLSRIDKELEKMSLYLGEPGAVVTKEVVQRVAGSGGDVVIFDLLDAIGCRDANRAVLLLRRLLQAGEPPVKVQFIIGRHVRDLLQVASMSRSGFRQDDIIANLKLHPYRARKLFAQASNFEVKELEALLEQVLSSDLKIKSSELTPGCWLELLVHRACIGTN